MRLCIPIPRWAGRNCLLKQAGLLKLSMSLPISCSGLWGPPCGGERQDLWPEEGPL